MSEYDNLVFAPMLITDVFDSIKAAGKWFDLSKAVQKGDRRHPYVARSGGGNGIGTYLPHQGFDAPNDGNAITIGVSTSTVFYQPVSFYTSKEIQVLRHPSLDASNGPLLAAILRKQMVKFQWGNGASLARLRATRVMVPIIVGRDGAQSVNWSGLTSLGEELLAHAVSHAYSVRTTDITDADTELPALTFTPMYVIDIPDVQQGVFRAHKGKRLITADRKPGKVPFIAGSRVNNSIVDFADLPAMFPAGWLTLIYNGDGGTGHCKYQPSPFAASDDVTALEPVSPDATEPALLMFATILTLQCVPKFGFGYKLTLHRLGRQKIMVPFAIDESGEQAVDWSGMSLYGRIIAARTARDMAFATGGG